MREPPPPSQGPGPGAPPHSREALEVPQIPDHELLRCIGQGSYGEVWLARNVTGSFRAVKVVRRRTFRDERPFEREFKGIERFEPVSRSHPGLVFILHVGRNLEAGYFYYVMEVADDCRTGQQITPAVYQPRTLHTDLGGKGRASLEETLSVGIALSSALEYLHQRGLVHRDIKPSNIIFVNGQPKFADIGLVTEIGESNTLVGTEGYLPPEGPGKPLADVYSFGKLLYEMLSGQSLQDFPELPTLRDETPDPRLEKLHALVLKACQLNPARRFASAGQLQAELLKISGAPPMAVQREVNPPAPARASAPAGPGVALLYQSNLQLDQDLGALLGNELRKRQFSVSTDRDGPAGVEWAQRLEQRLSQVEAVIVLVSARSAQSELLAYEVDLARDIAARTGGKPRLISIWIRLSAPVAGPLSDTLEEAARLYWTGSSDNGRLLPELLSALQPGAAKAQAKPIARIESAGGAVPLDSAFYIERGADREFQAAIERRETIVLVKGARQMGKTSLLARALQHSREKGLRVLWTDYQKLNAAHFASLDRFFLALAESLADQLDLEVFPQDRWDDRRSPNSNFERYLRREVLDPTEGQLVWGMDEVDRLFPSPFSGEVFGLFRSWHNNRALDPSGAWTKLTLAMAYATEAHLFISDLIQSPFNVGTRLPLDDFARADVQELNRRHGLPLKTEEEVDRLIALLGGQPFLIRRALQELVTKGMLLQELEQAATQDDGPFGDHLRRLLVGVVKEPGLLEEVRRVLQGQAAAQGDAFYRLRSAGVLTGESPAHARLRCGLYGLYLRDRLPAIVNGGPRDAGMATQVTSQS